MISERSREALDILRQTTDAEKNEIRETILNEYHDLEEALLGGLTEIVQESSRTAVNTLKQLADIGKDTVTDAARAVDEHISARPWRYLAGCAMGAAVLGFLLGRRSYAS